MTRTSDLSSIAKTLLSSGEILILSHVNPDGDALGSALGLSITLSQYGKSATAVLKGGVPAHYRWLSGSEAILSQIPKKNYDAIVLLDCGDFPRSGFDVAEWGGAVTLNVDHHTANQRGCNLNLVDEAASATGELVFEILGAMGINPPPSAATALYAAIYTDTGGFRYSNSTSESLSACSRLVALGANPAFVAQNLYERESPARTALLGKVLSTLSYYLDGRAAFINVTAEMLAQTGSTLEDTENFVNFPRAVERVVAAVFLKEKDEGVYRVTLRSKEPVDVASIAQKFGGGGHKRASGATLEGSLDEVRAKILAEIAAQLDGVEQPSGK